MSAVASLGLSFPKAKDVQGWTCGAQRWVSARLAGLDDHGVEKGGDIVSAIGPYLPHKPDVRYVPIEEARSKMGPYADALALDQVVRSTRSRAIGWNPSLHSVAGNAARLLEEWRAERN